MIKIFHGTDAATHDAYQTWRQAHANGFFLTEGPKGSFRSHWAQDKRENPFGRGCIHQGGSKNAYRADKSGCYTTAKKVCSDSLPELLEWASQQSATIKSCQHCDTQKFPFPSSTSVQSTGSAI